MANLGGPELVIILVVVLLVFGPGRLPAMSKSIGEAMREFRKSQDDVVDPGSSSSSGSDSNSGSGSTTS